MADASARLKKQYGDYGDIKKRGNGMVEFVLKKIGSTKDVGLDKASLQRNTKKNRGQKNRTRKNI
jgi:hypothetical protein